MQNIIDWNSSNVSVLLFFSFYTPSYIDFFSSQWQLTVKMCRLIKIIQQTKRDGNTWVIDIRPKLVKRNRYNSMSSSHIDKNIAQWASLGGFQKKYRSIKKCLCAWNEKKKIYCTFSSIDFNCGIMWLNLNNKFHWNCKWICCN